MKLQHVRLVATQYDFKGDRPVKRMYNNLYILVKSYHKMDQNGSFVRLLFTLTAIAVPFAVFKDYI